MKKLDPRAVWLFFIEISSTSGALWAAGLLLAIFAAGFLVKTEASAKMMLNLYFWLAAILFLLVLVHYFFARLKYHFYRYELAKDSFRKEAGVIFKKYVAIPYARIQNIDIYRSPVDRLLGLSHLHIQTAGMSASVDSRVKLAEAILPGLSEEVAKKLRDELISRSQGRRAL